MSDSIKSNSFINDQNAWKSTESIHQDLLATKKFLYNPCKWKCSRPIREAESIEYGACAFEVNNFSIRFRVAKITPTKTGQFVALWKRIENGPTQPYDASDPVDFFIISTRKDHHFGQFIFPKSVLCEQGVFSTEGKGGKRGIRVYSPWDTTFNRQAKKTQEWQIKYFLEIPSNKPIDCLRAEMLYGINSQINL